MNREQLLNTSKAERILTAATDTFASEGFHQATVQAIADRAGVGKGTVYLYFRDKSQLFMAMVARELDRFLASIREEAAQPGTARTRLVGVIRESISLMANLAALSGFEVRLPRGCEGLYQPYMKQAHQELRLILTSLFLQAQKDGTFHGEDPELAGLALVSMLMGLGHNRLLTNELTDPVATAEGLAQLLLR